MMMRNDQNGGQDPYYSLANVIGGTYDTALAAWAAAAKKLGYPILVEFGTEVTLDLFPWNGRWNGTDGTTYGTASVPDGPARFRDAYRHIINLCNSAGATNITWFYHVDAHSSPNAAWNTIDDAYAQMTAISASKPIAVLEFGVTKP